MPQFSGTRRALLSSAAAPLWVPSLFTNADLYINWKQQAPDGSYGMAWLGPRKTAKAANLLVSRTGTGGTVLDASGNVVSITGTALRATNAGLTTEEARTNSIRNNTMVGAVAGTPGTPPTNWSMSSLSGLSQTIVGTGTQNGLPYIDVRFFGTTTGTVVRTFFETTTAITASSGQTWTESVYASVVGGTMTNVTGARAILFEYASGTPGTTSAQNMSLTAVPSRVAASRTFSDVGTTAARPGFDLTVTNAAAVDITVRFVAPQLELGSFATTPILTSGAAVTRAQDFITFSDVSWLAQGQGSIYFGTVPEIAAATVNARVFQLDDGTENNFQRVYISTGAVLNAGTTAGGAAQPDGFSFGTAVTNSLLKAAFAWAPTTSGFAVNGASPGPAATTNTLPTLSAARLGVTSGGSSAFSGTLTELAYFSSSLTNSQLQAITT